MSDEKNYSALQHPSSEYADYKNPSSPYEDKNSKLAETNIPLDPGTGGKSIQPDVLQMGDIIVSTTSALISSAIKKVTNSEVSHTILYIGDKLVVEAIGGGVTLHTIDEALQEATVAVAFRHQQMDTNTALKVRDFAGQQLGKPYNKYGIVKQLLFRLDLWTFCKNKTGQDYDKCREWLGVINLGKGNDNSFFCSELVISAFQNAGLPLTDTPPIWSTPGDIVLLTFPNSPLGYIGHLRD